MMNRRDVISAIAIATGGIIAAARDANSETITEGSFQSIPNSLDPLPYVKASRIPVAFVLSSGAEVVDFAGPWGVFEYVYLPDADMNPFELYTVAKTAAAVQVSGGMTVVPNYTFANAPKPKLVVVPAIDGEPTRELLAWLVETSKSTDLTISVCNGSFVLAKAGLLSGKSATSHHGAYALLQADFPDIKVIRGARFVDEGRVATAGGLSSGIDLALHVVERYFGREIAEGTATALEYQGQGWKDPGSNQQFSAKPVSTDKHPICPVCEMEVDKETSLKELYRGKTYYLCSASDQQRFLRTPDRFTAS